MATDNTTTTPSVARSVANLQDLTDTRVLDPSLPEGAEVQGVNQSVQNNELLKGTYVNPNATNKDTAVATAAQADPLAPITAAQAGQTTVAPASQATAATVDTVDKATAATVAPTTQAQAVLADKVDTTALENPDLGKYDATQIGDVTSKIGDAKAATAEFTQDELLTGQLKKVLEPGENGVYPDWALGVARATQQLLAKRGIDNSSMAGTAITSALIDAAVPIADKNAAALQGIKLQNLSNEQQASLVTWQGKMSALLSDQAADNAAKQFNAASETQVAQFIASLAQDLNKFNANLATSVNTFNAGEANKAALQQSIMDTQAELQNNANEQQRALVQAQLDTQVSEQNAAAENQVASQNAALEATRKANNAAQENAVKLAEAQLKAQLEQFNAQLKTQTAVSNAAAINDMEKANAQLQNQREQFNVNNANLIEQSNATWRRQINTQNTAVANEVNRINALNKLQISNDAYNKVWQQFRDEASWLNSNAESALDRATNMAMLVKQYQLMGSNAASAADTAQTNALYAAIGKLGNSVAGNLSSALSGGTSDTQRAVNSLVTDPRNSSIF